MVAPDPRDVLLARFERLERRREHVEDDSKGRTLTIGTRWLTKRRTAAALWPTSSGQDSVGELRHSVRVGSISSLD